LNALKAERLNTPPKDISPSLEFRIREVEGWRNGLDAEVARRVGNNQVQLKPIRGEISAEDARAKYPEISRTDGPVGRQQNFQRKLALQVSMRQHNAPADAALASLRDELPNVTPASPSSATTRGPPTSAQSAIDQLPSAHLDELKAITQRDPVEIAQTRATAPTTRAW